MNQAGSDLEVPSSATPKRRSALERGLVWGGIALLLALAAVEAHARLGYSRSLNAIEDLFEAAREAQPVGWTDVAPSISGFPLTSVRDETLAEIRTYRWWSLLHDYRIHLRVVTTGSDAGDATSEVVAYATGADSLSQRAEIPDNPAPPPESGPVVAGARSGGGGQKTKDDPTGSAADGPARPSAEGGKHD